MPPFALHITWTTYGAWLPGDERGHVSNLLLPDATFMLKQNVPNTPYASGNDFTREQARKLQKGDTVRLTAEQALRACEAIADAAVKRGWRIVRAAAMANHIHNLVTDCPPDGPLVRRILKGVSQAALNDFVGHNQRWWTAGGSDRYKNDDLAIETANDYVMKQPYQLARIINNVASLAPRE